MYKINFALYVVFIQFLKCSVTESGYVPIFDERFDRMSDKCVSSSVPQDCASATACTKRSGIYKIQARKYDKKFFVACDSETKNGDWLIIQRRQDGSVDFYRNWSEYETGFGDIEGEFFIGLEKLYALTNLNGPQELLVVMEDNNGVKAFANYASFAIGNATEMYKLKRLGKYTGTAGNSLQDHLGMKFTAIDCDHDQPGYNNCAVDFRGGWWYNSCYDANLNGRYDENASYSGINWYTYRGVIKSLRYVKMMIRRTTHI